jgi:putative ABC transport system permease protein
VVFLCALMVAAMLVSSLLILRGAGESLRLAMDRLGADIVVVPEGTATEVENALLMGEPATEWMPESALAQVAAIPGVEAASPQLYLASLENADCCAVSNMFMVAYDPATDFTITPWLRRQLGRELALGQSVGGTHVSVPEGEETIRLYGYPLTLEGNLEPTGTNLDQSLFITFETAHDMARRSATQAEAPLEIPPESVSAVLVKVAAGQDAQDVAAAILHDVPGVSPIVSPEMFGAFRRQMDGLLWTMGGVLALTLLLCLTVVGLVFAMATHERRREIGVLRALGATRGAVLRSLLTQVLVLALAGGVLGIALAAAVVGLFRNLIVSSVGVPFLFPAWGALVLMLAGALALVLGGVVLAVLFPAIRVTGQDPAVAMRE